MPRTRAHTICEVFRGKQSSKFFESTSRIARKHIFSVHKSPSSVSLTEGAKIFQSVSAPNTPLLKKNVLLKQDNGKNVILNKSRKSKHSDGGKVINGCKDSSLLDISSMGLNSLSPEIGVLTNVTELYAYENKLTSVPPQIGNLKHLERLWLQENWIAFLSPELSSCVSLTHLDLRHNKLEGPLPQVISQLKGLKQLLLTYNKLTDISGVGNLKVLETLVVKSNNLQGPIPQELSNLVELRTLDLSKNRLTEIPSTISYCTKLGRLLVDYNQIGQIPESIEQLKDLKILGIKPLQYDDARRFYFPLLGEHATPDAPSNKCDFITQYVCQIPRRGSQSDAERQAGYWIFVVELDLSYNVVDRLPDSIGEMISLEVLDLTSNRLKNLCQLCSPKMIPFSRGPHIFTSTKSLPRTIGKLRRLTRLHLEFNQITFLPLEIGNLAELQLLNLESNQLSRLPSSIGKLSNLMQLKLTDNLLQRLPTEMGQLKRLTHLYLKNNSPLDQLPIELAVLPDLKILTLDGCNLRLLPAEVVQGGSSSVIKYFRGLLHANVEMFKHLGTVNTDKEVTGEAPGQPTRKLSTSFSYALRHSDISDT
ncbi:Leucine-rich repeat protein soc-2 [Fasciola gigantica]|uniref:Leucine-rich repeat protein soc-2 n=1 Tax=Fasciola gigantica TaxID=46835 RepID=A0A504Y953_FASGI|nr:Leucine-rich repeat protein soc-2 [Fasciola gigantica]